MFFACSSSCLFTFLFYFWLTKPSPPPLLPVSPPWTRRTPLGLAARDEIFKVYWYATMRKRGGNHILIHLSDSNLLICKMMKCALVAICTSQHMLYYTSFLKLLQLTAPKSQVRIQCWAADMWKSYKIWMKSMWEMWMSSVWARWYKQCQWIKPGFIKMHSFKTDWRENMLVSFCWFLLQSTVLRDSSKNKH